MTTQPWWRQMVWGSWRLAVHVTVKDLVTLRRRRANMTCISPSTHTEVPVQEHASATLPEFPMLRHHGSMTLHSSSMVSPMARLSSMASYILLGHLRSTVEERRVPTYTEPRQRKQCWEGDFLDMPCGKASSWEERIMEKGAMGNFKEKKGSALGKPERR